MARSKEWKEYTVTFQIEVSEETPGAAVSEVITMLHGPDCFVWVVRDTKTGEEWTVDRAAETIIPR